MSEVRLVALWAAVGTLLLGGICGAVTVGDEKPDGGEARRLPEGPLADRVEWLLAYVNTGEREDQIERAFTPEFLREIPAARVREFVAAQLRPSGVLRVESITRATSRSAELSLRSSIGYAMTLRIAIEENQPHRIAGYSVTPAPEAPPAKALAPSGPVGDQLRWILEVINGREEVGEAAYESHFADSFRGAVPYARFMQLLHAQLRPGGPFVLERYLAPVSTTALAVVVRGPAGKGHAVRLVIQAQPPHRITGLLFQPPPSMTPPKSWTEVDRTLAKAAPDVSLLAAEVVGDRCRAVHSTKPREVMPLGSAFKLYVLGALARTIEAKRAGWDEQAELRDELRVHSSLAYAGLPNGTKVSLRDLALNMISVSDNTATDHVMARVGRGAVEVEQGFLGMAAPKRNVPFLTTRELTLLKWVIPASDRDEFIAMTPAERARFLDTRLPKRNAVESGLTFSPVPIALDSLEWFASAEDLCLAHVRLQELASRPGLEPVRSILATNAGAGVPIDREVWPYVAFKGGSEPGVLALSWYAERRDGRRFAVMVLMRNSRGAISDLIALDVAAAFTLLAKE